jgi:hypothetical protein
MTRSLHDQSLPRDSSEVWPYANNLSVVLRKALVPFKTSYGKLGSRLHKVENDY